MPTVGNLPAAFCALLLAAALMGFPAPGGAQEIEEEDLTEPELEPAAEPVDPTIGEEELVALYAQAEAEFRSPQPQAALGRLDRLVERLELRVRSIGLSERARGLYARTLCYRAQLYYELEAGDLLAADLGRMLELQPGADCDPESAPQGLQKELDQLRRRTVGELRLIKDPPDLVIRIDGRRVDPEAASVAALAGTRVVEAERPGYAPRRLEVEVRAGKETDVELLLERTSALIRIMTRPSGCEVTIDGIPRGTTSGVAPADFLPQGAARIYRPEEFSDTLVLTGVEPGLRVLEVHREGHRPYRAELVIEQLLDYELPPIVLEQERGVLVFRDLPAGATIQVDGTPVRPDNPDAPAPQLALPPGEHEVHVSQGPRRMFATRLRLADRQTVEVNVRLRPGLAWLGVLGGDPATARDLDQSLRLALEESGRWALLDRTAATAEVLAAAGLDAGRLRAAGRGGPKIAWIELQAAFDERAPGLLYVAAVVTEDLMARRAEVLIWPAGPGPARPDRVPVTLGQPGDLVRLMEYFHRGLLLRRPWIGALVVDSAGAPHPIIADLTPEGPLARAGAQVGDQIVAVAGVPVFSQSDFAARIAVAETGETVEVGLQSPAGTRSVRVELGTSPLLVGAEDPDLLPALAFTELVLMEERADPESLWVIRLNQALILMRAREWEEAVRRLRGVRAPQPEHGLGQATVDYWLGIALNGAGPSYREAAAEAFRRAAEVPGARLDHHDGAWVAPRARARLRALGVGGG